MKITIDELLDAAQRLPPWGKCEGPVYRIALLEPVTALASDYAEELVAHSERREVVFTKARDANGKPTWALEV